MNNLNWRLGLMFIITWPARVLFMVAATVCLAVIALYMETYPMLCILCFCAFLTLSSAVLGNLSLLGYWSLRHAGFTQRALSYWWEKVRSSTQELTDIQREVLQAELDALKIELAKFDEAKRAKEAQRIRVQEIRTRLTERFDNLARRFEAIGISVKSKHREILNNGLDLGNFAGIEDWLVILEDRVKLYEEALAVGFEVLREVVESFGMPSANPNETARQIIARVKKAKADELARKAKEEQEDRKLKERHAARQSELEALAMRVQRIPSTFRDGNLTEMLNAAKAAVCDAKDFKRFAHDLNVRLSQLERTMDIVRNR